jgi:hypothetical protein
LPLAEADTRAALAIDFSSGVALAVAVWLSDVADGCFVMVAAFALGFVMRVGGASFFSFDGGFVFGTSAVIFLFFVLSSSAS